LSKISFFSRYIGIYLAIVLITTIWGLVQYPYYQVILNAPINQIEKLPIILAFLRSHGIFMEEDLIASLWMIARIVKGSLLEILYTFVFSYVLYYWFSRDIVKNLESIHKAIYGSLVIIFLYSSFEIIYLAGNETAQQILTDITPFIHSVKDNQTWWPPLLWKGQLRSIFSEPSYFGMYASFAMPFLWYDILKSNRWKSVAVITTIFTFLLFLTKARTAFALFLAESVLLLLFWLFLHKSFCWKKVVCIFLCGLIAFVGANLFINKYMLSEQEGRRQVQKQEITLGKTMTSYVDDNAKTIANPQKRSNGARFSVILANISIGKAHPFLGVGSGLKDAYITDYLPDMAADNQEVQMWKRNQKEKGILKSGYPNLCEYATRFSETGIIGLVAFLFPMFFLIYCLVKKIRNTLPENRLTYIMFLISFLGICATGLGDSISTTYCYWILLGLGYALCFENEAHVVK